jgi:hypothetical protein
MAKDFPKDEFDSVSAPGGRHRAKPTAGSRIISFVRYAAVSVGLAVAGIVALNINSGFSDLNLGAQTVTQSQFKAGGLGVTVIDATSKQGLAGRVASALFDAGWNVLTATNYALLPKWNAAPAPTTTVAPIAAATPTPAPSASSGPVIGETTVIYVTSTQAQSAAQELMGTLGKYQVIQANTYSDPITIVLGSDYK